MAAAELLLAIVRETDAQEVLADGRLLGADMSLLIRKLSLFTKPGDQQVWGAIAAT